MNTAPIQAVLPELINALRSGRSAVLTAPPGAGKTTRVPIALLDEPWLAGKKIVMLEPRRLAARASADYMARSLGERVGERVGYRVRHDTKVGPNTRIEVVTEGVLTRMLQEDPALEHVGIVVFDEFHERSLHADLGLALCLQAQTLLRDDLRLLVMSATLEAEPVAVLLGDAATVRSEGRSFPVETRYEARRIEGRIEPAVVRTIQRALEEESGDLLVFLPGAGEIRNVQQQLERAGLGNSVRIRPLHGSLAQSQQDEALSPAAPGIRRIVLATSIAETSLTVEGVRVVIDCGLMRVPRFSPRTGMTRLETVTVSRASADQRRGRAGRTEPGVCYRLWAEQDDRRLAERSTPEMLEADLAPLALELAVWGTADPQELAWLDPPPAAAYRQAQTLLTRLGAMDEQGHLTPDGRRMAGLGIHPRLAHMALQAVPRGMGQLACLLAALLEERDVLKGSGEADADIRLRVEALLNEDAVAKEVGVWRGYTLDAALCRRVLQQAGQLAGRLGLPRRPDAGGVNADDSGSVLAFAYPDRIAQRRSSGRFLLENGRGAVLAEGQALAAESYLVAAELDDHGVESRIYKAAPLSLEQLETYAAELSGEETTVEWDREAQAVRARRRVRLGAIVLSEKPVTKPDPRETVKALLSGIEQEGLGMLPWTKASRQLQERLVFLHRHLGGEWREMSDEALLASMSEWLVPHVEGIRSRTELSRLQLVSILESGFSWTARRELDDYAPTHMTVPSGSRIPVDYSNPDAPALFVRLQELFGWQETPRIARGRVPLTLHLLSPAQRPVQVTQDLAGFWRNTYFEVKKDLRGRYPKHYWPDDPLQAEATSRAKPRPRPNG